MLPTASSRYSCEPPHYLGAGPFYGLNEAVTRIASKFKYVKEVYFIQGASRYDVRKHFGYFDSLPPCPHLDLIYTKKFTQPPMRTSYLEAPLPVRPSIRLLSVTVFALSLLHLLSFFSFPKCLHAAQDRVYASPINFAKRTKAVSFYSSHRRKGDCPIGPAVTACCFSFTDNGSAVQVCFILV